MKWTNQYCRTWCEQSFISNDQSTDSELTKICEVLQTEFQRQGSAEFVIRLVKIGGIVFGHNVIKQGEAHSTGAILLDIEKTGDSSSLATSRLKLKQWPRGRNEHGCQIHVGYRCRKAVTSIQPVHHGRIFLVFFRWVQKLLERQCNGNELPLQQLKMDISTQSKSSVATFFFSGCIILNNII